MDPQALKREQTMPDQRASTLLRPPRFRQRGTALFEFVLILPIIFLVFVLLLYFGQALVHAQKGWVVDRYESWRQADNGTGPYSDHGSSPQLNELFHKNKATALRYDGDNFFPNDAPRDLQAAAGSADAQGLVSDYHGRFPRGRRVEFSTSHPHDPGHVTAQFDGPIEHQHTRLGPDWKFANGWKLDNGQWEHTDKDDPTDRYDARQTVGPWNIPPIRDRFFPGFDQDMSAMNAQGNPMGGYLRAQYNNRPNYKGPEVKF
jgi:hypothetical protein